MKVFFTILAIGFAAIGTVEAGAPRVVCHNGFRNAVVLQQVQPYAYYSVGAQLQEEAVANRIAALVLAKLGTATATAEPPAVASLLTNRCAKCHTGEAAKAGFRVDQPLTCEQRLKAIRMVLHDDPAKRMPKGAELPADELGVLIQHLAAP